MDMVKERATWGEWIRERVGATWESMKGAGSVVWETGKGAAETVVSVPGRVLDFGVSRTVILVLAVGAGLYLIGRGGLLGQLPR